MRLVHHQAAMIEKQSATIERQSAKVNQLLVNDRRQSHLIDDMRIENKASSIFILFEHEISCNKIYWFLLILKYWNYYLNIHGVVFGQVILEELKWQDTLIKDFTGFLTDKTFRHAGGRLHHIAFLKAKFQFFQRYTSHISPF